MKSAGHAFQPQKSLCAVLLERIIIRCVLSSAGIFANRLRQANCECQSLAETLYCFFQKNNAKRQNRSRSFSLVGTGLTMFIHFAAHRWPSEPIKPDILNGLSIHPRIAVNSRSTILIHVHNEKRLPKKIVFDQKIQGAGSVTFPYQSGIPNRRIPSLIKLHSICSGASAKQSL